MTASLFIEVRGKGPDLVLIHGWGMNSGVWETFAEPLYSHFRIHFIDLPGFGRNADCLPNTFDLAAVAKLIVPHIPDNALLMGWSMGGLVAQHIAIKQQVSLSCLILMTSTPHFVQSQDWPGIKPGILEQFEQQLEKDFTKTLDRFLAIQAMGSATARRDIRSIHDAVSQYPVPDVLALRHGLRLLSEVDLRREIKLIKIPTHWLFGRLDSLVPHALGDQLALLQPAADVHLIEHASHAPFISHPQEIQDLLLSFRYYAL